jgi:hypothetical protein
MNACFFIYCSEQVVFNLLINRVKKNCGIAFKEEKREKITPDRNPGTLVFHSPLRAVKGINAINCQGVDKICRFFLLLVTC